MPIKQRIEKALLKREQFQKERRCIELHPAIKKKGLDLSTSLISMLIVIITKVDIFEIETMRKKLMNASIL